MPKSTTVRKSSSLLIASVSVTYATFPDCAFTHFLLGVRVEYLPPYSPDLNPIEEAFSKIKHWVRRYQDDYGATQGDGILYDMLEVLEIITSEDAEEYFIHAGYF
jgi:transposase